MQNGVLPARTLLAWMDIHREVRLTVWGSVGLAATGVIAVLCLAYVVPAVRISRGTVPAGRWAGWQETSREVRLILRWSLALAVLGVLTAATLTRALYGPSIPIYVHMFVAHELPGCVMSATIILTAAVLLGRELIRPRVLDSLDRHRPLLAAALAAFLVAGTLTAYHNLAYTADEYCQLFQARIFAHGRLWAHYPPELLDWLLPHTRDFLVASPTTGRVISAYWPGVALFETPFVLLGVPWLFNPLLGVASLLLIRRLAAELYPGTNAPPWAMLLTLASPAFIVTSISYYGMPAQLFLNLLFTLLIWRLTPRALLAAGVVGSFALVQLNPVPHTFYALPWIVWLGFGRGRWRRLAWLAVGYLPLYVLLGVGWALLRFQFSANGGSDAGGLWQQFTGYGSSAFARDFTASLFICPLHFLKLAAWTVPGLIIAAALGARRRWADGRIRALAASALVVFFGYLMFWMEQGHGWSARYFHPALGTLPLLACGLVAARREETARGFTPLAQTMGTLAVLSLVFLNGLRLLQVDAWLAKHLAQRPPLHAHRTQVCFIRTWEGYWSKDFIQNDPFLRQRTLFLKSHGRQTEKPFMAQYFPGAVPRSNDPNEPVWYVERDKPDWWVHGGQ
jgi:hypothetical protein